MRSAKRPKSNKKSSKHDRVSKKRYTNTQRGKFGWNDDLSGLFIDNINEAIRINKSRPAVGKGSWKLVPKDSREVYKDRKKRSATNKKTDPNSEEISNDTESAMEEDKTENKKKLRKKYTKKMIQSKKSQSKKQRKKRSNSYSKTAYSSSSQSTCYSNESYLDDCCY